MDNLRTKLILLLIIYFVATVSSLSSNPCSNIRRSKLLSKDNHLIFFVDIEHGNDDWSGTLAKPNVDNTDGPFRTIEGAFEATRRQRKYSKSTVMYIRKGYYFLKETIVLNSKDSNLKILGYPGERKPVISGGIKIPGGDFKAVDEKIWAAPFHGTCSWHVYLGSRRMFRARKPNIKNWRGNELVGEGPYLQVKDVLKSTPKCNRNGTGGFKQNCPSINKFGFIFNKGDINPDWVKENGKNPIDVLVFHAWTAERGFIKKITKDNKVMFELSLKTAVGTSPKPSGWRYIVENVKTELDAVGEFFCDESEKMLYLIPPKGILQRQYVFIAQTETLFRGNYATNIVFRDLSLRYSNQLSPGSPENPRPALLEFSSSKDIRIHRCDFRNVGRTGVFFSSTINSVVMQSTFQDIGDFGVDTSFRGSPKDEYATKNILIQRNTFRGCGVMYMEQPSCIYLQGVSNIKAVANDISKTPYAGIRAGWQQTFTRDVLPEGQYVFVIALNNIHEYGRGILNDFAAIYLSSNPVCGSADRKMSECHLPTLITYNTIHNAWSHYYGAHGVYGDTALSSLSITKNWIYNITDCEINFHCGQYNRAVNNMIYHTSNQNVFGTCHSIDGHGGIPKQILTFTKNVVYVANTEALMFAKDDPWQNLIPVVNYTDYYFNPFDNTTFQTFFPGYRSWEEWRNETGNDIGSIIANPLFVNISASDFRLSEKSPALKLGIKSVDLKRVLLSSGACKKIQYFTIK